MDVDIVNWSNKEVLELLHKEKISQIIKDICKSQDIDGQCLLSFVDRDFYDYPFDQLKLGERKRFILLVKKLQRKNRNAMYELGLCEDHTLSNPATNINFVGTNLSHLSYNLHNQLQNELYGRNTECMSNYTPDKNASRLKPEIWKTAIALGNKIYIHYIILRAKFNIKCCNCLHFLPIEIIKSYICY